MSEGPESANNVNSRPLTSWKEIAQHFGRDVRTVQRWEKEEGLPVHRHPHKRQSSVYAYQHELDTWWHRHRDGLETREVHRRQAGRRRLPWLVAAAALPLLAASLYVLTRHGREIDSIAVLPFANATAEPDMEYLSDGITESIIHGLSQLPTLRKVIAHSSVMSYKGRAVDPRQVGRELDVQAVLAGRILQQGEDLTLEVELLRVADGSRLWGERYHRNLANIFTLQEEIPQEICENLRLRLTGQEKTRLAKRQTESGEAYQAYLKGRYFWNKRTEDGLKKGIEYFEEAIAKDPNYPLPYAGLADSYALLGTYGSLPPKTAYPKAKAAAVTALGMDDTLAEAHASLGLVRLEYDWQWREAEKEYKRALNLNPGYATAHQWYAEYLTAMGRSDEAIAEIERAHELDPLSLIINAILGWVFYYAGRHDRAIQQFHKTLELDANFARAHFYLGRTYLQKEMFEQAIGEFQKAIDLSRGSPAMVAGLAHAYAVAGQRGKAIETLDDLKELSRRKYLPPYETALIYAGLGERDQALAWLEKAYEERSSLLVFLKADPRVDSLRSNSRFQELVRRLKFPE